MVLAVCTTTDTLEEAKKIARGCVEAGLAACAHIDQIESCFYWDGALQEAAEHRVMLKTAREAYPKVEALIAALHSYDEPAIYAFPIEAGSQTYLDWVRVHSKGG